MVDAISLLRADFVKHAEGDDFERLSVALLAAEVSRRHRDGDVNGKPPKYLKDGGVDILVTLVNPPNVLSIDYPWALTPDGPGRVAVSCKTGKNWMSLLGKDAKKSEFVKVVKDGGYAIMMVHHEIGAVDKAKHHKSLATTLAKSCGKPFAEIAPRLRLIDASDIAFFYNQRPVSLDLGLRLVLSIPGFDGLLPYDEWTTRMRSLRLGYEPEWSADGARVQAVAAIQTAVRRSPSDTHPQAIWLSGPPGVGKSRLVVESLRAPDIAGRVLAASDYQYGAQNINGTDAPRLGDGILVVDEVSPSDVAGLAATFAGRAAGQGSTLILIGPPDKSLTPPFGVVALVLEPLSDAAERALVQSELGPQVTDELTSRITHLTEGFPWFAVLLAKAVREDPDALPATANQWDAAKLAIAGPKKDYGGNEVQQDQEAVLRSKALLAVMMTEGTFWPALTPEEEGQLSQALDAPWGEIRAAAMRCYDRGLIRERQNWRYKYVTPRNLGRVVAKRLLFPPYSLGARISAATPELREYLYGRLEDAELPDSDLQKLSEAEIAPFGKEPSWDGLRTLPLSLLAKHAPGAVARATRAFVEAQSLGELAAHTEERRKLVWAMNHVCRRKGGFVDAEASLFRLALAENESWGNNATGVWKSLFLGILSLTHSTFEDRLDILEGRR